MKIIQFEIENFKGISKTIVRLEDETPGNIVTLIGLNESGKTTILEAISHFLTEDKDTAGLVGTVTKKVNLQDLIPKDKKAAFTGQIAITATVRLEPSEIDELADHMLEEQGIVLDKASVPLQFVVKKVYEFKDSNHEKTQNLWMMTFKMKSKRAKTFKYYDGIDKTKVEEHKLWNVPVAFLRLNLPKIVYFPTFLFDFPDRIYLEKDDKKLNSYYVQVIQDVLDSQGDGLSIQTHIIDRINKVKTEHTIPATFLAFFFQKDERKQIDAVLQKASNEMSKVIFGSWNQILGKSVTGKNVQIEWLLDGDKNNVPYLEVSIVDGQSKYSLSERSLGFRWFFSFLLFTEFRRNRKSQNPTIFLFDEPAANLHSKAQMKLLESFSRIATKGTYILYSTHSHYMVNPLWLEKAYIIDNKATDYDNEDDVDSFAVRKTDITAVRYKTFVGSNPTKTTYFQPVLDALEVTFSPLLSSSKALIVEGKNDFYPFSYLRRKLTAATIPQVFPGNGAGSSGTLISLFRGWGVNFRILLDDDKAGQQAKKKYMDEFFLSKAEVVTLGEIEEALKGQEFEALYKDDVVGAANTKFGTKKPTKRQLSLYFQELLASGNDTSLPKTEEAFRPISEWVDSVFPDDPSG